LLDEFIIILIAPFDSAKPMPWKKQSPGLLKCRLPAQKGCIFLCSASA
jgi:hypothetical protein